MINREDRCQSIAYGRIRIVFKDVKGEARAHTHRCDHLGHADVFLGETCNKPGCCIRFVSDNCAALAVLPFLQFLDFGIGVECFASDVIRDLRSP